MREVGIPAPEARIDHYPHQFSGGMRQRVVIALAICAEPRLIIADEPTTALDVSIQAQIIAVAEEAGREHGTAVMLITHDMGVIAETADRVAVMYAGRIAEIGPVREVIRAPAASLHGRPDGLDPEIRDATRAAPGADRRRDAAPERDPVRLRVQSALSAESSIAAIAERPELLPAGASRPPAGCTALGEGVLHESRRSNARSSGAAKSSRSSARDFDVSPPWLNRMVEGEPRQSLQRGRWRQLRRCTRARRWRWWASPAAANRRVARLIVGLYAPTCGRIRFDGVDIAARRKRAPDAAAAPRACR